MNRRKFLTELARRAKDKVRSCIGMLIKPTFTVGEVYTCKHGPQVVSCYGQKGLYYIIAHDPQPFTKKLEPVLVTVEFPNDYTATFMGTLAEGIERSRNYDNL